MKVVHVLKRIEMIDNDIKELKKLEKSIEKNKSFSTPIYMSIEKQINILLGERIKLFELKIDNPPAYLVEEIEGKPEDRPQPVKKPEPQLKKKKLSVSGKKQKPVKKIDEPEDDDEPVMMLTQDQIDAKFGSIKSEAEKIKPEKSEKKEKEESVKLLDIALEKGSINRKDDGERKVRFFRENFPGEN